jgi:hypothetical protein
MNENKLLNQTQMNYGHHLMNTQPQMISPTSPAFYTNQNQINSLNIPQHHHLHHHQQQQQQQQQQHLSSMMWPQSHMIVPQAPSSSSTSIPSQYQSPVQMPSANDPQLSALHFHLQREQAFNMLRNGARFFDPRFNMPRNLF